MSKYIEMTHDQVIDTCKKYMNDDQVAFVEKAYEFANKAHAGQNGHPDNLILFTQRKLQELWLRLA